MPHRPMLWLHSKSSTVLAAKGVQIGNALSILT